MASSAEDNPNLLVRSYSLIASFIYQSNVTQTHDDDVEDVGDTEVEEIVRRPTWPKQALDIMLPILAFFQAFLLGLEGVPGRDDSLHGAARQIAQALLAKLDDTLLQGFPNIFKVS